VCRQKIPTISREKNLYSITFPNKGIISLKLQYFLLLIIFSRKCDICNISKNLDSIEKRQFGKKFRMISRVRKRIEVGRLVRSFRVAHVVGFGYTVCHQYVTSAFEASTTRKNQPPVGLEVRKATRDILLDLDSTNIYAYSARGNEYLDMILFIINILYCFCYCYYLSFYIIMSYDHFVYNNVS